jgi:hypothetical protein
MTVQKFSLQIEHLLLAGVIQDCSILKLYRLLKAYEQGKISAEVIQTAINQHEPERIAQWLNDNLPPLFD